MSISRFTGGRAARLALVAAAALTPLLWAPPAGAVPAEPSAPGGSYVLTVQPELGSSPVRAVTLTCGPDGGTHAYAATACDQLRRAAGRVERIPEDPGMCTREHAPVRVTATGTWNGRHRHFAQTYSNHCTAVRATGGSLFAF
ncbi:proteinase inhibitor I16 subtilisin-type inhibitor [Planomonospora sphaerica]|uniref:Proteinase inhibitor I16 subtilisin-type inhibitor n=1 Tax=Planomonospora sphaerica TaxID=161355 RepID=A0A171DLW2_9ACTN|nr:SSI family serine proteinase inhibitor [Planomonospora sphaerica]GAT69900.1 proteinase inhibitor I16 subtilisin-type inhibitor [Planomonospora sphaerica]